MRFFRPLLLLPFLVSALAQEQANEAAKAKHDYQSDVSRLRKIVVNSLYSHKEVFLRELLSNANDALEKLRLTSLTDKSVWDNTSPLNITMKLIKDEGGKGGRIVISDTGIGMTPEELTKNLGTLAKSGTSEFLAKAESDTTGNGNLIGAFGLGFYSSFLVADRVYVASIPPATEKNPNPVQHVFSSFADEGSFEIYPDPRGNTLGRGTEITLVIREDSMEYLEMDTIKYLVDKHSGFSTTFPIYLYNIKTEEVPIPEDELTEEQKAELAANAAPPKASEKAEPKEDDEDKDDDEAVVEDVDEIPIEDAPEVKPVPMKNVTTEEWLHLNQQPPLWMRDPKDVTAEEYKSLYQDTFKDREEPLAWHHFKGDSGSGVSFRAIIYVPRSIPEEFWHNAKAQAKDVRLLVKRVFITNDFGVHSLPKWASYLKVIVDADDLPLNVSRETLQSTRFLAQIRSIIIKRWIHLLQKASEEDESKFKEFLETYGPVLKIGAIESEKDRKKLIGLARFTTNQRNFTSLDQYVEQRKKGQTQIFYLAAAGKDPKTLLSSVFVEKLTARGYEVVFFTDPMDEIVVSHLRNWKGLMFQDAAKKGLKFGDEEKSEEEEKEEEKKLEEKFKPLVEWLREEAKDVVMNVIVSNRLLNSPCAIVAEQFGYSANMLKLMAAQNSKLGKENAGLDFMLKQKSLEINPRSPLIEGLLRRVEALPKGDDVEKDVEAEAELKEVASILIDGALVRSGFEVADTDAFFTRVDRVLRRSLGVSETAKADVNIKPAPPVADKDEPLPEAPGPMDEIVLDDMIVESDTLGPEDPAAESKPKDESEEAYEPVEAAEETSRHDEL